MTFFATSFRTIEEGSTFVKQVMETLVSHGFSDRDIFSVQLSMKEAIANAINHGNQQDSKKSVTASYEIYEKKFCATITDEGAGFNIQDVSDPLAEENLERPTGRGVFLMNRFMDTVEFNQDGNEVTMTKKLCCQPAPATC